MHGSSGHARLHVSSVTETTTTPLIIHDESQTGAFKIYRNGLLAGSASKTSTSKANAQLIIGNRHLSGTNPTSNGFWYGNIYEVLVFDTILSDQERYEITNYLSRKWNLGGTVDSDGDGYVDSIEEVTSSAAAIDPLEYPETDFSDSVDAQIGEASGLDTIESNLSLWLDASNIDLQSNTTLSDGDAIAEWIDLSGNGNNVSQSAAGNQPIFNGDNIEFDGSNDYMGISDASVPGFNNTEEYTFIIVHKPHTAHNGALIAKFNGGVSGKLCL